jgi:dimethylargininase
MTSPSVPVLALVRRVADAFTRCLRTGPDAPDPDRAREQHAGYVAALVAAGVEVVTLAAGDDPDGCFVEDTAVILDGRALISRPGAPARRGECGPVAAALAGRVATTTMPAPAVLDGGDVLRVGPRLLVGLSLRSDAAGARVLAEFAAPAGLEVVTLPLAAGLHLKSAVTLVDERTAVVCPGAVDPAPLRAAGLELLAVDEPAGGNVLALGRRVLVSASAPRTADVLARRGVEVATVDVSEFHRADGALTCLSLRVPPAGGWCA